MNTMNTILSKLTLLGWKTSEYKDSWCLPNSKLMMLFVTMDDEYTAIRIRKNNAEWSSCKQEDVLSTLIKEQQLHEQN